MRRCGRSARMHDPADPEELTEDGTKWSPLVVDLNVSEIEIDSAEENISGGELRRLVVARTLYSKPRIVLADEPTNDLDRQNREIIGKVFREMTESGITVIAVTHDEELAGKADDRFLLKNGKLELISD